MKYLKRRNKSMGFFLAQRYAKHILKKTIRSYTSTISSSMDSVILSEREPAPWEF